MSNASGHVGRRALAPSARSSTWRRLAMAAAFGLAWGVGGQAAQSADSPYKATTSRAAREEALRSIPYKKLDADGQAKVSAVLNNVSMYRRLPTQVTRCDPELYLFMINHPDVTVNLWQALDVTQIQLLQTGRDTYRANDGQGTKGDVQFLYRSHDVHLIYAVGTYEGPIFQKPVRGSCLLLLKTGYSREPDGNYYITSQLDTFFNLEHVGLDLLTRTFHPLVGRAADYNFIESASFLGTLYRKGETSPIAVQQLAEKLNRVQPEQREQFAMLMASMPQKAAERSAATAVTPAITPSGPAPVRIAPGVRR